MQSFDKYVYRALLGILASTLAIGTVFYHVVEKFSWVDAYYFSVVTLATVGYGDLSPKTDIGKLFTTFYILTGIGIVTAFVSYGLRRRAGRYTRRHGHKKAESTEE